MQKSYFLPFTSRSLISYPWEGPAPGGNDPGQADIACGAPIPERFTGAVPGRRVRAGLLRFNREAELGDSPAWPAREIPVPAVTDACDVMELS